MSISDESRINYWALSIPFGAVVAIISVYLPVTLPRVLNVLAIIQATFLSIIIAIYILGNQVLLERYSSRVLELDSDRVFTLTVALFGGSIFFDLLFLLFIDYIVRSTELTFYTIWVTFTLATGAFFSLILMKNRIIGSAQPESVANLIRESITEDQFWKQTNGKGHSQPFHNEFEVTRNALRNDDRQDSRNILNSLTSPLRNLSDSVFPPSDTQAAPVFVGFMYIITELSTIGELAVERDDKQLINTIIEVLRDISIDAVQSDFDNVSTHGVGVIHDISKQLIPSRVPETLAKSAWLSYGKILDPAAKNDATNTIGMITTSISGLVADIEEESRLLRSASDKISEILIRALLDGWKTYLQEHGQSVPVSEVGYGDPKYFSGDLLEYEHSFNHFEDGFQNCSTSIFRIYSTDLGESRIIGVDDTILDSLKDLGVVCTDIDNEGLAYHFSMLIIFIGIGLDYGSSDITNFLKEIQSANSTGRTAINQVFAELRKFPNHNGPSPTIYMGTRSNDLYNNTAEFRNNLMEIEI